MASKASAQITAHKVLKMAKEPWTSLTVILTETRPYFNRTPKCKIKKAPVLQTMVSPILRISYTTSIWHHLNSSTNNRSNKRCSSRNSNSSNRCWTVPMESHLMEANQPRAKSSVKPLAALRVRGRLLLKVVIDQARLREIQEMASTIHW